MPKRQPNSRHCFVCGLENPHGFQLTFFSTPEGDALSEVTIPAQYQGYPGIAHSGVVAALLDEVGSRALMAGEPDRFVVTAMLNVKYRRPVPVGVPLTLIGRRETVRSRWTTCRAEVRLPDGRLAAEAEVILADVPDSLLGSMSPEERLGWRVYPDGSE